MRSPSLSGEVVLPALGTGLPVATVDRGKSWEPAHYGLIGMYDPISDALVLSLRGYVRF